MESWNPLLAMMEETNFKSVVKYQLDMKTTQQDTDPQRKDKNGQPVTHTWSRHPGECRADGSGQDVLLSRIMSPEFKGSSS